jgi:hypothetical protein
MAVTIGILFHDAGKIWANGYGSGKLEDSCPGREYAMGFNAASVGPQKVFVGGTENLTIEPRFYPRTSRRVKRVAILRT